MVQLDENGPVMAEGRDVNVINQKIKVEASVGWKILEVVMWIFIIPGIILLVAKIKAKKYFEQLQQKLQHDASQIDNYLEQRVMILQNVAKLVDKAIALDKDTLTAIAQYRGGGANLNDSAQTVDGINRAINVALENYPDIKAHKEIEDAMQQNSYLQREITAAREVYNDTIATWNREIFVPIAKLLVAAKEGYTTRIPFATTAEIKEKARGVFF